MVRSRFAAYLLVCIWVNALLTGCANENVTDLVLGRVEQPVPPLGNAEFHTNQLANELFGQVRPSRHNRYAVVGFVPVENYKFNPDVHHPLQLLGHQLREGFITEATKRGYTTQEFLMSSDIKVTAMHDRVLSRDVEELARSQRIDFYITGTVLPQEAGAMVNARIVNVRSQEVVAAATRFFPGDLFWREEQITLRQGRLYRTGNVVATTQEE